VSGEAPGAQGSATLSEQIRVLHGDPTAEELAVVVAVVAAAAASASAAAGSGDDGRERSRSGWTSRARAVHAPLHAGPGGWRASALPQG
jgi:hypothetical protein